MGEWAACPAAQQQAFCSWGGSSIQWSYNAGAGDEYVASGAGGGNGAVLMEYYPTPPPIPRP